MSYEDFEYNTPKKTSQDALDVTKYDIVYLLLSYSIDLKEQYPNVKYNKNRNKYYLVGKVMKNEKINASALRLLEQENAEAYNKEKKVQKKEELLTTVHFGCIESIVLDFNSLDWKP